MLADEQLLDEKLTNEVSLHLGVDGQDHTIVSASTARTIHNLPDCCFHWKLDSGQKVGAARRPLGPQRE